MGYYMSILMEMMTERQSATFGARTVKLSTPEPTRHHIDLSDSAHVTRWCRLLGATPLQLCSAIEKVGTDPTAVQRLFRMT